MSTLKTFQTRKILKSSNEEKRLATFLVLEPQAFLVFEVFDSFCITTGTVTKSLFVFSTTESFSLGALCNAASLLRLASSFLCLALFNQNLLCLYTKKGRRRYSTSPASGFSSQLYIINHI